MSIRPGAARLTENESELVQIVTGKDEYMIGYETSLRHSNSHGPHLTDGESEAGRLISREEAARLH